jgi:hypothetical protein
MKNAIYLLALGLVVAVALWLYLNKDKAENTLTLPSCVSPNPGKFPPWNDASIPHGDLNTIANQYVTPVIGGNDSANGSLAGGFFKSIDVYPSIGAAKYYQSELLAWANSFEALPYWQTLQGEYLCLN